MKRLTAMIGAIALNLFQPAMSEPSQPTDEFLKMGAYVAASDIERSAAFYETVLGQPPIMALDSFIAFDVAGGILAVVSKSKYAPGSKPSLSAVPYIQVNNMESLRNRLAPHFDTPLPEVIKEPGIHLLKLTDPEGQTIEFFELVVE